MVGSSVGEIMTGKFVDLSLDNSELNASIVVSSEGSVLLHSVKKKTFQHVKFLKNRLFRYEFVPYLRGSGTTSETHLVELLEITSVRRGDSRLLMKRPFLGD